MALIQGSGVCPCTYITAGILLCHVVCVPLLNYLLIVKLVGQFNDGEKEREREGGGGGKREREREREI